MKSIPLLLCTALLALSCPSARALEYFVSRQGDDARDGQSRETAFRTIQKGVDALAPGDTLTIGPGEYAESVRREGLGNLKAETTIRAELPGTVVLRGDVALDRAAFRKVDGFQYVYAIDFSGAVQGVNEVDTLRRMAVTPTVEELEYAHGSCFYDAAAKRLFISTSDARPPREHHYTVSVVDGHGLLLARPRRVTLEGIAATGFQSAGLLSWKEHHTRWGILLLHARQCVIRNCVAWLNGGGIAFDSGKEKEAIDDNGWNLTEHCRAFANGSKFAGEGGNILGFTSNHDEIRDSYAFLGEPNNLRLYGAGIRGPAVMRHNLAWGGSYTDIFIKGGQAPEYGLVENCVTLGLCHVHHVRNSIIGTANQYNRHPDESVVSGLYGLLGNQQTLAQRREEWFADAANLDFRLQATAPLRASGPDGTDRGAYPYEPTIFYVKPGGDDAADGLSMKKAWKSLPHALARLRPGDTLYLEGGVYDPGTDAVLSLAGDKAKPTSLRGRGNRPVILRGDLRIAGSRGLEFERLNFTGTVALADGRDIAFNNCRFSAATTALDAVSTQNLKVTHCEFTGFGRAALALKECRGVWLGGNLYDNAKAPAVRLDRQSVIAHSDYNAYSRTKDAWQVAKKRWDFAALQQRHDRYSRVEPARFTVKNGLPVLENAAAFGAGGPNGGRLGFYQPYQPREMRVSAPRLHSVTDTTANLEWRTQVPATLTLAWGETPELPHRVTLNEGTTSLSDGFNTLSLTGLKPGTQYHYRLLEARPTTQQIAQTVLPARPEETIHTFTTAKTPGEPRVLHVAPNGDDARSGLSREEAWKTVARAADAAEAGDTVLIAGGVYTGTVRIRASGSPGKPITFKAAPGEKVIFDGAGRSLAVAFSILGKEHIRLEGLYFRDFGGAGWRSVVDLRESRQIRVERCFFNAHGSGTPGTQLRADRCEEVVVANCVIARGFQGITFRASDKLRVENNVFLNNLICPILNSGGSPGDIVVKNNIFVDSIVSKVKVHLFEFGGFKQYVMENNAFYLRVPDEERQPFFFYGRGEAPYRMSLAEYEKKTGQKNLVVDDPRFAITEGKEPKDPKGKPVAFLGDWIPRTTLDFPDLFTQNPELTSRHIGLLPGKFPPSGQ
ncbi:MAG TPA: chondroitinase-B domain-containing protein [Chthoniobacteraceae bacterium]|nr:chondroitinase-B domain-containing protein [Chthoniobacteraceae bacterium]